MSKILDRIESCTEQIKELAQQTGQGEGGLLVHVSNELESIGQELRSNQLALQSTDSETLVQHAARLEQTRCEAEKALKRSQRLVSECNSIFTSMTDGVVVFDVNGIVQRANPATVEAYGFDPVSVDRETTLRYIDLHWPDGRHVMPEELPSIRTLKGEVIHSERSIQVNGRGEDTTILTSAAPLYDPQGNIFGSVVIWHDITALERSERNDRFLADLCQRLLTPGTPEEIYHLAARNLRQYLHVSRCMINEIRPGQEMVVVYEDRVDGEAAMPEYLSHTEMEGNLYETLLQEHLIVVEDMAMDARTSICTHRGPAEVNIRSYVSVPREMKGGLSGRLVVCDTILRKWHTDEIALLSSAADLIWLALERVRLFNDLRRSQERFDLVLRNSAFMVFATDSDLRYTWVYNPKYGFATEDMLGKRDDELLPPEDVRELVQYKQEVISGWRGVLREVRVKVDGKVKVYNIQADPIQTTDGSVVGLSGIAMEITERKLLEEEMQQKTTKLEIQHLILQHREMERMQIARDLHDGILQDLVGLGFMLSEVVQINEKEARLALLSDLKANLTYQIRELRAFCSELRPPALAPFGVQKALLSHLETFQTKHPEINMHADLMPDGKRLTEAVRLVMFRVCQELLNNSVKHSQASQIWVHFALDEEGVELEVRDNGRGFTVPRRWVDLVRKGHLGLAGIQERADAVGGKLDIETIPGQGTRVRMIIPIKNNPKALGTLKL